MTIGIVLQNDFPVDSEVRTRKVAKTLDESGEDVVICARATLDDETIEELRHVTGSQSTVEYATVERFSWGGPIRSLVTAALPFNPFWCLWILLTLWRHDVRLAIASDLRAPLPTAVAARMLRIPLIVDVRENYPEFARLLPRETLLSSLTLHPFLVRRLERAIIGVADLVWVVVEERRDTLIEAGVPRDKLRVVSNTPELSELADAETDSAEFAWPGFAFVYVGLIDRFRGLDTLLDGIAELQARGVEDLPYLVIGGDGPHRSALERRAHELEIDSHVVFTGWIDAERVPAFIASGDVGAIPHHETPFTHTTIPNKLFDYMAMGIPVLATDMAPVRRVITTVDCGWVLPPEPEPADVASTLREIQIAEDRSDRGQNGQTAVRDRYHWGREAEVVRQSIADLDPSTNWE